MKALVLTSVFALISFSGPAFADHYSNKKLVTCRVTRMVDSTFFEEALSTEEYPDVDVAQSPDGQYSVQVGANKPYEMKEGDGVVFLQKKNKGSVALVTTAHKDILTLEVEYRSVLARATLKVQELGKTKAKTVASLMCDKGIFELPEN